MFEIFITFCITNIVSYFSQNSHKVLTKHIKYVNIIIANVYLYDYQQI